MPNQDRKEDEKTVSIRGIASELYKKIAALAKETERTVGEVTNEAYKRMMEGGWLIEKNLEKTVERKFRNAENTIENLGKLLITQEEVDKIKGTIGFSNIDELTLDGIDEKTLSDKISYIRKVRVLNLTGGTRKVNLLTKIDQVKDIREK